MCIQLSIQTYSCRSDYRQTKSLDRNVYHILHALMLSFILWD